MMTLKRWVYRLGFRPKPGSVFYSPSLAPYYQILDNLKKRYS